MYVKWKLVLVHFVILLVLRKIGARFVPNIPQAWKSFWAHPIVLLANVVPEEARFDPSGDSVNLGAR